jgi:hypothetical protein
MSRTNGMSDTINKHDWNEKNVEEQRYCGYGLGDTISANEQRHALEYDNIPTNGKRTRRQKLV